MTYWRTTRQKRATSSRTKSHSMHKLLPNDKLNRRLPVWRVSIMIVSTACFVSSTAVTTPSLFFSVWIAMNFHWGEYDSSPSSLRDWMHAEEQRDYPISSREGSQQHTKIVVEGAMDRRGISKLCAEWGPMTATTLWNEAIVVIRTDWALPKYSPGICL